MLAKVFRIAGIVLAVALIWALVFGWWQSNDHQPDLGDLALYMLALPLALIGGYWLLRFSIDQLKAKPGSKAAASSPTGGSDTQTSAEAKTVAAERGFSLSVVETFVVAAGGSSAEEILAAVEANKRPKPMPELIDSSGFPAFAATVDKLDAAVVAEAFADSPSGLQKLLERDDALRALGLLERVLKPACEMIAQLAESAADPSFGKLNLRLLYLLPAAWGNDYSADLQFWLRSFAWPPEDVAELYIDAIPVASDVDAMRQVDAAILKANQEEGGERLLILVAGAMSTATQGCITEREATVGLFSSQSLELPIPGEGAAAILFAPKAACAKLNLTECVTVSRVAHAIREKALYADRRIRGTLISKLIANLLKEFGVTAEAIKAVVVDTDHRSAHSTEMLEGFDAAFSDLDPLKDCPAIGTVNGYLTPLGGLLALACACHRARADQAPTLCLSNQHDRERAALLVRPAGFSPAPVPPNT
ncbi:MAG: hypothetical protein LBU76_03310 [Azoarcus sp.]|jgi:hypothetical protein|nr:hypothetical protein [Azoarcus sp.]